METRLTSFWPWPGLVRCGPAPPGADFSLHVEPTGASKGGDLGLAFLLVRITGAGSKAVYSHGLSLAPDIQDSALVAKWLAASRAM